jgi:hypothetical protein
LSEDAKLYPSPCCGYFAYKEEPDSYEICEICFWEDDLVQLRDVSFAGGTNRPSLLEAQKNYAEFSAKDQLALPFVRQPRPSDRRDPTWHPFDPDRDVLGGPVHISTEVSKGIFLVDHGDVTANYYWRRRS